MVFHILTAVLVLFKIMGYIDISWWLAIAPSLVSVGILLVFGGLFAALIAWCHK